MYKIKISLKTYENIKKKIDNQLFISYLYCRLNNQLNQMIMEFKNIASNVNNKKIFNVDHKNELVSISDEFCQNISGGALSTKSIDSKDHETVVNFCDMLDAVCEVVRSNDDVDVSEYDVALQIKS